MSNFRLLSKPLGAVDRLLIQSPNKSELEILLGHGACLNAWRVAQKEGDRELLQGYSTEEEFLQIQADTSAGARLSPFAGRVDHAKWSWKGVGYQLKNNVSWAPHALHGLVHQKPWRFESFESNGSWAELVLAYEFKGEAAFPFPFLLQTKIIFKENAYQVDSIVKNIGDSEMPYSEGYHPYYTLGAPINELCLQLPPVQQALLDDLDIPNGNFKDFDLFDQSKQIAEHFINDCFVLKDPQCSKVKLLNENTKESLEIWQESLYKCIQIYTPPHRKSIAIEPMTHVPNVLNHHQDLWVLAPNQEISSSFGALYLSKPLR